MEKRIEEVGNGLKCDNPECDWKDETIKSDDMEKYLNAPCPKCGENILTEQDYKNTKLVLSMVDFINNLTEEEFELLSDKEIENPKQKVIMHINTHKEIKVERIEPINE